MPRRKRPDAILYRCDYEEPTIEWLEFERTAKENARIYWEFWSHLRAVRDEEAHYFTYVFEEEWIRAKYEKMFWQEEWPLYRKVPHQARLVPDGDTLEATDFDEWRERFTFVVEPPTVGNALHEQTPALHRWRNNRNAECEEDDVGCEDVDAAFEDSEHDEEYVDGEEDGSNEAENDSSEGQVSPVTHPITEDVGESTRRGWLDRFLWE